MERAAVRLGDETLARQQALFAAFAPWLVHHLGLEAVDQRAPLAGIGHVDVVQRLESWPSVVIGALAQPAFGRCVVLRGGCRGQWQRVGTAGETGERRQRAGGTQAEKAAAVQ